jgi:2-keto-4-pentenoate hydratase/2-oxohepta-3-ene-1,7-dioic acid hydratase in catechol pathway
MLDYEVGRYYVSFSICIVAKLWQLPQGELCFIVKRDAKNIAASQAQEYILGYTAGNDISSRLWQRPPLAGGQYCYAKGFDKFAPIGPTVRHARKITMDSVSLQTLVNGKERQSTVVSDMLFSPSKILEHLSSGCTVRKGTVVMTGTPSGIAGRMKGEPWLRDGDVVEVCISGIGKITNQIVMSCHNRL